MLHSPKMGEPIPGYLLKERIGVGGYGEVWSASAPGGLTKAIKFVYGYFDDARASRELKALDRIKQVRHPFLLSLERFEIVDGQLIIVTELADQSLKDRFEQARTSGQDGVPRDELLGYLRDAADALDYMSEKFTLQHLDVKPENLLLVGGRVKVADFGLVKNLHEVAASMMGGLTPIYAAPEVFDDRPSEKSDQYSLAIVYQEMLSGILPFPGRTPAQLAAQHLHASPRLATLPAADQLVIAQALAKNPVERFSNCRALVDALLAAEPAARAKMRPAERAGGRAVGPARDTTSVESCAAKTDTDAPRADGETVKTQILGRGGAQTPGEISAALASHAAPVEPIADLPPLDLVESALELRPTLFLGIGGTASRTLRRLRRRLRDRFGSSVVIPSLRTLLLDTDTKSLTTTAAGEEESSLEDGETMALPLRSAREYTSASRNMMQWLSRRWLYNIPRSQQTEGRRPLGRLALVDHAPQLIERLRSVLAEVTAPEAIAASVEATGVAFRSDMPRVYVVASVSGGTGGGMALDVAYAVRQTLADQGLNSDGVFEILTHSTDRNPSAAELATANAYASLTELHHYGKFGYRPGDQDSGLPPFKADRGNRSSAYFVHLGHGLNDREFDAATDELASYLYLNAVTSAGAVFDKHRATAPDDTSRTALRSFSLATIGGMHNALPRLAAQRVCREIVDHWRGIGTDQRAAASLVEIAMQRTATPDAGASTEIAEPAARHAAGLELSVAELREKVAVVVNQQLGGDAETVFDRLPEMVDAQGMSAAGSRTRLLLDTIRRLFDPTAVSEDVPKPPAAELRAALEQGVRPIAGTIGRTIGEWILEFINDPAARVAGAVQAKQWYADLLRALEDECASLQNDVQHNLQAIEQTLLETEKNAPQRGRMFGARAEKKHAADVDGVLLLIVQLRMQECTLYGVGKLVRLIAADVAAAGDRLKDVQHVLGQWSQQFEGPLPWGDAGEKMSPSGVGEDVRAAMTENLRRRLPELVRTVDEQFQSEYLQPRGGLRAVCDKDALRDSAVEVLRARARSEVFEASKQVGIDEAVLGATTTAEERQTRLGACLEAARPKFSDCGGAQRLLAFLPGGCTGTALQECIAHDLTPPATVSGGSDAELVFCYEQQELSLAHVAARLIDGRNDIIQIAGRLHTRMDVPWSQLPQLGSRVLADGAAREASAAAGKPK